ncbi:MAG: hypothetical protein JXP34_05340, partial [Planctomycetes bacterium]|nr:hypothetical protein [Planctomycetota bacterium]
MWVIAAIALLAAAPAKAPSITNDAVRIRAAGEPNAWVGFDVLRGETVVAPVRLSSNRKIRARTAAVESGALVLRDLEADGATFAPRSRIAVRLRTGDPYPKIEFDLDVTAFDPAAWQKPHGPAPFHFLTLALPEAACWHQRGWLMATPKADPFPLLGDVHVGSPEVAATWDRNWSYAPSLAAHPLPVIGLWDPAAGRYAGFLFQEARLTDGSERDLATAYAWKYGGDGQFVSLVFPHAGRGFQTLVHPRAPFRVASHFLLVHSADLPATRDPNALIQETIFARYQDLLPRIPRMNDLGWIPGACRLRDFPGPGRPGLIAGQETPFNTPDTRSVGLWRQHNECAYDHLAGTPAAARYDDGLAWLRDRVAWFTEGGARCAYWPKPIEGRWVDAWGGDAVKTLHNAQGFGAGRFYLARWKRTRDPADLAIVEGIRSWADGIAWTRNEFADVPSSPFAIGGTLPVAFLLDYHFAFRDDRERRERAWTALDLARAFAHRYLVVWPSDNDRWDALDSTFLLEPNSGRGWTGAACANEVLWTFDTLVQAHVHTGDRILGHYVRGILARAHLLYAEAYRPSLAQCGREFTECYGLADGCMVGTGARASYGWAEALPLLEPVGDARLRAVCGVATAIAFAKGGTEWNIESYRVAGPGDFSFTVRGGSAPFAAAITFPFVDLREKPVRVTRGGLPVEGNVVTRPPASRWSLAISGLRDGDEITVGTVDPHISPRETLLPLSETDLPPPSVPGFRLIALPYDAPLERSWEDLESWAGLPIGLLWSWGVPYWVAPEGPSALTNPARIPEGPVSGTLLLAYEAGGGERPAVRLEDGTIAEIAEVREALAWRAWPPIFRKRLAIAPIIATGPIAEILPRGRRVLAATLIEDRSRAGAILVAIEKASEAFRALLADDAAAAALAKQVEGLPAGRIAILPPRQGGAVAAALGRCGALGKAETLDAAALVDPARLSAARTAVALFLSDESYVRTVREPGDGIRALRRYVEEGGTLVVATSGPYPFYEALERGARRAGLRGDGELGLPIRLAFETPPANATLVFAGAEDRPLFRGLPDTIPFAAAGDLRLRAIDRRAIGPALGYAPLYEVRDDRGRSFGDAAGMVLFPGGGRILYVWMGLASHPQAGRAIVREVCAFV